MMISNKSRKIALTPGKLYYIPGDRNGTLDNLVYIYIKDVSSWYKDKNRIHTKYYQFIEISTGRFYTFGPITVDYRLKEL